MKLTRRVARLLGGLPTVAQWLRVLQATERLPTVADVLVDEYLQRYLHGNPKYHEAGRLPRFGFQVYSQNGEDGIIEEIFNRIGLTARYFVEFGVGDGSENNTTYLLVKGWRGVWLERDPAAVEAIRAAFGSVLRAQQLTVVNAPVTAENVEQLFGTAQVPEEFDLLSIDVDGSDYWIWRSLQRFRPRVVVIEYNALYPPPVRWVQTYEADRVWDGTSYYGASLKSLELLGASKGYQLVGCSFTGVNAFFVRDDLVGDKFCPPFTAEHHHEPPRFHLLRAVGFRRRFGDFVSQ